MWFSCDHAIAASDLRTISRIIIHFTSLSPKTGNVSAFKVEKARTDVLSKKIPF
jgi:hypothetical protein